jgi:hypothetical protein
MRLAYALIPLFLAGAGYGDTLVLRSGQVVNGTYLGGTARQIRMDIDGQIQTFEIGDVTTLSFSGAVAQSNQQQQYAPPQQQQQQYAPPQQQQQQQQYAPPQQAQQGPMGIQIPPGTNITVRMIDGIDSRKNTVGQTFNASLDEPVILNGNPVIPRGADAIVKLVDDKQSGKIAGKTVLTLDLVSVRVNGQMVDINTQSFSQASGSRGARTAKMAGGGAALGAIIGGIAGGGKGAAIGAGAGAGAGVGAEVLTKGQQVKIPSETRLTFVVDTPVNI